MKKLLITLLFMSFISSPAFADDYQELLLRGIKDYKEENYLGTIQSMSKIVEDNPGSMLAYYYLAISYAQIGKLDKAEKAYNNVIYIDPNSQLAALAELGKERLYPKKTKKADDKTQEYMNKFENKFYSENVEESIKKRKLKYIIDQVNSNREIKSSDLEKFENFTPDKSAKPTPDEIAKAYQTLTQAGFNPGGFNSVQASGGFNPEMMQMSMLAASMGGNSGISSGGNSMNMLPLLMMMQNPQGQQKIDPEFMQTMISNMMMPDLSGFYGSNKNY